MTRKTVATENAPAAVGPYSQAVISGDLVFCSGQVGLDPSTGDLVTGSVEDETRRCLQSLGAVLEAAGCTFADVVKVTAFLTDMNDFAAFNSAYGSFFEEDPPARATIGVAGLPKGARVEVECIARVP
ncbi:MAG TPA: RidA family protein [Actinomycetota bacterium]|jgi:2-iminobutanoate/2-iminopropanoate deaminase|nr:RidA family protein [Actinomycetota bacterium]